MLDVLFHQHDPPFLSSHSTHSDLVSLPACCCLAAGGAEDSEVEWRHLRAKLSAWSDKMVGYAVSSAALLRPASQEAVAAINRPC
jgi:hypothetical protein